MYSLFKISVKLRIFLLILDGNINKEKETIVYSGQDELKHTRKKQDLFSNRKIFDFDFSSKQKRKLNEYDDDLLVYISKKPIYLEGDEDQKNFQNKEIATELGSRKKHIFNPEEKTSTNTWVSTLDKYLSNITNQKLDLSYFENENGNFWMDLNHRFLLEASRYEKYEDINFPTLNKEDPLIALGQIVNSCEKTKKKGVFKNNSNFFLILNSLKRPC